MNNKLATVDKAGVDKAKKSKKKGASVAAVLSDCDEL